MSGGHFNYQQYIIKEVAEEIESLIEEDFRYTSDFSDENYDRLGCEDKKMRKTIVDKIKKLLTQLSESYEMVDQLDRLLCGDIGPETFLERINK